MAGFLWIALNHRPTKHHDDPVTKNPRKWRMFLGYGVVVGRLYGGMSLACLQPYLNNRLFLIALPFALFDTLALIFSPVCSWPFA